jgi:hypothetical protein
MTNLWSNAIIIPRMGDSCLLIDDHFSGNAAMKHTQFLKFLLLILVVASLAACTDSEPKAGATNIELLDAMTNHIIAQ